MQAVPDRHPEEDAQLLIQIRRKAEAYRRQHPQSGPAVFLQPELSIEEPGRDRQYPSLGRR